MRIRRLELDDVPACVAACRAVGWRSDDALWRRVLAVGVGFGAEAEGGELAGTVVVNRFGEEVATIAMMVVPPAFQRRGLGRRLLGEAMAAAGGAVVSLYATELGRRLYEPLGFVADGASTERFQGVAAKVAGPQIACDGLRPMRPGDRAGVHALDARSQGAARTALLDALVGASDRALVVERDGAVVGFGAAWPIERARALAPIVAAEDEVAYALAAALAEGDDPVRIDLEPGEQALRRWARDAGLVSAGTGPRMVEKGRPLPGERRLVRALAGRAYG